MILTCGHNLPARMKETRDIAQRGIKVDAEGRDGLWVVIDVTNDVGLRE